MVTNHESQKGYIYMYVMTFVTIKEGAVLLYFFIITF